jgi:hypothetical protein
MGIGSLLLAGALTEHPSIQRSMRSTHSGEGRGVEQAMTVNTRRLKMVFKMVRNMTGTE